MDVTNYVLLELGQPMHAFDLAKLAGKELRIRRAKAGERIKTLDGVDRALDPEMLVIADAEKAQAVAGVMGGGLSEVSGTTKTIVLESAFFEPEECPPDEQEAWAEDGSVRALRTGRRHKCARSRASSARSRSSKQIGAGTARGGAIDDYPVPVAPRTIELRRARIGQMLGLEIADLTSSGFSRGWDFGFAGPIRLGRYCPTFRVDVLREVDLIEEVARHYGYERLPATFPALTRPPDRPIRESNAIDSCDACSSLRAARKRSRFRLSMRRSPPILQTSGRSCPSAIPFPRSSPSFARRCCRACSRRWRTIVTASTPTCGCSSLAQP